MLLVLCTMFEKRVNEKTMNKRLPFDKPHLFPDPLR